MSSPPVALRLALLEPEALFREALAAALTDAGFAVSPHAAAASFLAEVEREHPTLGLLDASAGPDALATVRLARERSPQTRLVAIACGAGSALARRIIGLGGAGVLDASVEHLSHLVDALRSAAAGEHVFPNGAPAPAEAAPGGRLSPREREVLGCVAAGYDNLKIAALLGITERTVKAHVSALYRKLQVENRTQLALRGLDLGAAPPSGS